MKPIKTLTAIIGAAALASFGCGDDVSPYEDAADAYTDNAVSETAAFSFEGEAVYCSHVTESPVYVTCLDIYADINIKADNKILTVYANVLGEDKDRQQCVQAADSDEFHYMAHNSLCMRDVVVNGVELVAEDAEGSQGIYAMPENCARLEELIGEQ
ncbi:MAG: hypothetical protein KJ955_06845 [Nanoarchaeota archaeon]|nr:hypothetical protein [Nanoarchaeota archaeon]